MLLRRIQSYVVKYVQVKSGGSAQVNSNISHYCSLLLPIIRSIITFRTEVAPQNSQIVTDEFFAQGVLKPRRAWLSIPVAMWTHADAAHLTSIWRCAWFSVIPVFIFDWFSPTVPSILPCFVCIASSVPEVLFCFSMIRQKNNVARLT